MHCSPPPLVLDRCFHRSCLPSNRVPLDDDALEPRQLCRPCKRPRLRRVSVRRSLVDGRVGGDRRHRVRGGRDQRRDVRGGDVTPPVRDPARRPGCEPLGGHHKISDSKMALRGQRTTSPPIAPLLSPSVTSTRRRSTTDAGPRHGRMTPPPVPPALSPGIIYRRSSRPPRRSRSILRAAAVIHRFRAERQRVF